VVGGGHMGGGGSKEEHIRLTWVCVCVCVCLRGGGAGDNRPVCGRGGIYDGGRGEEDNVCVGGGGGGVSKRGGRGQQANRAWGVFVCVRGYRLAVVKAVATDWL